MMASGWPAVGSSLNCTLPLQSLDLLKKRVILVLAFFANWMLCLQSFDFLKVRVGAESKRSDSAR